MENYPDGPHELSLPLELFGLIFEHLGKDKDIPSLRSCALLSSAFLQLSRLHLFGTITINGRPPLNTNKLQFIIDARKFAGGISKVPQIAQYIRTLDYCIGPADIDVPNFNSSLKMLDNIETLHLSYYRNAKSQTGTVYPPQITWESEALRPTLLHLFTRKSLRSLSITDNIYRFPIADLCLCTNLLALEIEEPLILPEDMLLRCRSAIQPRSLSFSSGCLESLIKSLKARLRDGTAALSLKRLERIKVTLRKESYGRLLASFFESVLEQASSLSEIHFCIGSTPTNIFESITPLPTSLTTLKIDINMFHTPQEPYLDFYSHLQTLQPTFYLEEIWITQKFMPYAFDREEWMKICQLLTGHEWVSLRKVDLCLILLQEHPYSGTTANIRRTIDNNDTFCRRQSIYSRWLEEIANQIRMDIEPVIAQRPHIVFTVETLFVYGREFFPIPV